MRKIIYIIIFAPALLSAQQGDYTPSRQSQAALLSGANAAKIISQVLWIYAFYQYHKDKLIPH